MTRRAQAALAAGLLALAGCSQPGTEAGAGSDGSTLTVFAAASLEDPFTEIADQVEEANPGLEIILNLDGSSGLVTQLQEGAPADVLATASTSTMDTAVESGLTATEPQQFTSNGLMIAVPAGNPAGITGLEDLTANGTRLVICARAVPCGEATATLAENADLQLAPVSEENSVTGVLGKVTSGEADAGLVYTTDVTRGGDAVEGIAVPADVNVINEYPIAVLEGAQNAEAARAFTDAVLSAEGQAILAEHGFGDA